MKTVTMNRTISTNPNRPSAVEGHRPRVQEDDLDVEDDEEHRGQVELDREPAAADRLRRRLDAALVRLELGPVVALRADERRDAPPRTARTAPPGRTARRWVRKRERHDRSPASSFRSVDVVSSGHSDTILTVRALSPVGAALAISHRRRHPGHRVDDPVHGVAAPRVGEVGQQLEHEPHQRRVRHAVLGGDPHDLRVADQLHEHAAEPVVPAEAGLQLGRVRAAAPAPGRARPAGPAPAPRPRRPARRTPSRTRCPRR